MFVPILIVRNMKGTVKTVYYNHLKQLFNTGNNELFNRTTLCENKIY